MGGAPRQIDPKGLDKGDIAIPDPMILERTAELAEEIAHDYQGRELMIVGIMEGAVPGLTDLTRALHRVGFHDFKTSWITIGSYGSGIESNRNPKVLNGLTKDPEGKDVLVFDEVSETGHTSSLVEELLVEQGAKSVEFCILVQKTGTRLVGRAPKYIGFILLGADWLQGRGMDSEDGVGREDPDIRMGPYYYGKEPHLQ